MRTVPIYLAVWKLVLYIMSYEILMYYWTVSDRQQCLEQFNFVTMLNWIVRKRTVWSFNRVYLKMCWQIIYSIDMQKHNLTLNNQQGLIFQKTKPNHLFPLYIYMIIFHILRSRTPMNKWTCTSSELEYAKHIESSVILLYQKLTRFSITLSLTKNSLVSVLDLIP